MCIYMGTEVEVVAGVGVGRSTSSLSSSGGRFRECGLRLEIRRMLRRLLRLVTIVGVSISANIYMYKPSDAIIPMCARKSSAHECVFEVSEVASWS